MADRDLRNRIGGWPLPADAASTERVRAALRRLEAPDGFTDRVMACAELRAEAEAAPQRAAGTKAVLVLPFGRPGRRIAYAAAALLAITAGAVQVEHARFKHRRAEQRRTDIAAAQLDTALAVTNHALDRVSAKLATTEIGQLQRALEENGGNKR